MMRHGRSYGRKKAPHKSGARFMGWKPSGGRPTPLVLVAEREVRGAALNSLRRTYADTQIHDTDSLNGDVSMSFGAPLWSIPADRVVHRNDNRRSVLDHSLQIVG